MSFFTDKINDSNMDYKLKDKKRHNSTICPKQKENLIDSKSSVLSLLLKRDDKRYSVKTVNTNFLIKKILDYNLKEIKRFDEVNSSFSDISDFDLEKEKDENESEFNSSEDGKIESDNDEEIFSKNKNKKRNENDYKYELEIEKEYEEIVKNINIKKNM